MASYADPSTTAQYDEPYAGAMRRGYLESAAALAKQPTPIPVRQYAGLDPYEMQARSLGGGLGGFTPYIQQGGNMMQGGYGAQQQGVQTLGGAQGMYGQGANVLGDAQGMYGRGAGITGQGADVLGQAQGMYGQGTSLVGQGTGMYGQAAGMTGQAANMFAPGAAQQFYNPYEDQVVQSTIEQMNQQNAQQGQSDRARAVSSGAFGGSRGRLMEQEREKSFGRGLTQAVGGLRQQGYQQAQQAAQQAGQGLGQLGSNIGQFGQGLGALGGQLGNFGQGLTSTAGQYGNLGGQFGQFGQGLGALGGQYGNLGQGLTSTAGQYGNLGQGMGQMGTNMANLGMTGQRGLMNQIGAFDKFGQAGRGIQNQMYGAQFDAANRMAQEPTNRMTNWKNMMSGMLPQGSSTTYGTQAGGGVFDLMKMFGMMG